MRTTVTLDPDVEAVLRRAMQEKGLSFKQALNEAVRVGTASSVPTPRTYTRPRDLGAPRVNLDQAMRLAGDLEDAEIIRKMRLGK